MGPRGPRRLIGASAGGLQKRQGTVVGRRLALVVANPKSSRGCSDLDAGIRRLEERGFACEVHRPEDPSDVPALLRRRGDAACVIVLGGGDGTFHRAAEELVALGRPLGILPLGTANDLARTLGIPSKLEQAFELVAEGATRRIDLGRANGKLFFNVASVGLATEVARRATAERKRRLGVLSYPLALLEAVRDRRPFRAEIECDGERHRLRTLQVSVGNGRHHGGGLTVVEDAAIDDHRLDLYAVREAQPLRLLRLLPALHRGRRTHEDEVLRLRGRRMAVRTRRPLPVNVDGEIATHTPVVFEVEADALEVFVPREAVR